jgi:hypothetical protein
MPNNTNHLHNVFFRLKDSSPELISKLIRDCYTYLQPEDGVLFFSAGSRAKDFAREVNDTDFHVALTILFKDSKAHDAYQISKQHNIFIDRNKDNWAGARVFDSNITAD